MHAVNVVERRLVLAGVLVHGIFVQGRVVHHDGQTVDVAFLGDGFRFGGSDVRCLGVRKSKGREQCQRTAKCSRECGYHELETPFFVLDE
ncbi:hypothetical protein D3C81_1072670 [compost metagenome]